MGRRRWWVGHVGEEGQATVEAAVLIPTVMVVLALLLQPAMLLYTRAVMSGAAAEGARLATTATYDEAVFLAGSFVKLMLCAVPDLACFH